MNEAAFAVIKESIEAIRAGECAETLDQYRARLAALNPDPQARTTALGVFDRIAYPNPVHQEIHARMCAAERNPRKLDQHLLSATELAEANGIAHFGRWSEQQVIKRAAFRGQRTLLRKQLDREVPK